MADPRTTSRSLSEIGHLFLSSVRERHMEGAKPPRRLPPGSPREKLNQKLEAAAEAQTGIEAHPQDITGLDNGAMNSPSQPEEAVTASTFLQPAVHRGSQINSSEHYISLDDALGQAADKAPGVAGIVASHLNGKQAIYAKDFARRLAANGKRVGMIELGSTEINLIRFEAADTSRERTDIARAAGDFSTRKIALVSPRQITDALEEMSCELDQWLLIFPGSRPGDLRLMLSEVPHWIMLSSCDHDGLVSCYRSLKGALDQQINHPPCPQNQFRPQLSLALIDGTDPAEMDKVYRKISSVCKQFMQYSVEKAFPAESNAPVSEYLMLRTAIADSANFALSPQWNAVMQFARGLAGESGGHDAAHAPSPLPDIENQVHSAVQGNDAFEINVGSHGSDTVGSNQTSGSQHVSSTSSLINSYSESDAAESEHADLHQDHAEFEPVTQVADRIENRQRAAVEFTAASTTASMNANGGTGYATAAKPATAFRRNTSRPAEPAMPTARPKQTQLKPAEVSSPVADDISEVIELADENGGSGAIVSAVLRSKSAEMVECPITPPMCAEARLAVSRDRQILLVAAARNGLGDLRSIARAYQWLVENHKILCMALPQFAIDANIKPAMYLLVDHVDMNSDLMQPLFETATVTVTGYRRLRWSGKAGLLLS